MIRFALDRYRQSGLDPAQGAPPGFAVPEPMEAYDAWQAFNVFTPAARADLERRLAAAGTLPMLSVVMPVYNPPLDLLAGSDRQRARTRSMRTGSCASPTMRAPTRRSASILNASPPRAARAPVLARAERQHQPRDEFGGGARTWRVHRVARPGRPADARCARRNRPVHSRAARGRHRLLRRRQDRFDRPPLRAAIQARLVAGTAARLHVLQPCVRGPARTVCEGRRHARRLRRLAGLRLRSARDRMRARDRTRAAGAVSLARAAGLDRGVGCREARELRCRPARGAGRAAAARHRRAGAAAGMGAQGAASASSPSNFPTMARRSASSFRRATAWRSCAAASIRCGRRPTATTKSLSSTTTATIRRRSTI